MTVDNQNMETEELKENMNEAEETKENMNETEAAETEEAVSEETAADTEETDEAAEEEEASEDPEGGKKEKRFKKKDKKDKKDMQIEDLTDKLKRQMAEIDNFRKRTEKEKNQMFEVGAKSIIEKILPVVDNFERGLASVPEEEKENPFVEGMEKVYKQMMTMLEEAGVAVIEAEGKEFDPNFHNAVMHIEDENFGENIVAEEFQKGYTYRDSVVRHSMVKVAN